MIVRALEPGDLEAVATRVGDQLTRDARRNSLVNPDFRPTVYKAALVRAPDQTWVAEENGQIVGHLFGALLDSAEYGLSAWVGPDGVSFDRASVLTSLYREARTTWIRRGAREHFAWVFDREDDIQPWRELGYFEVHRRGVLALGNEPHETLPASYSLRRGDVGDLQLAVALDRVIDDAQSTDIPASTDTVEAAWRELLEDEEVTHYVVEFEGRGVAQCVTYPLDPRRGSFERAVHLSGVAVLREHQHRGLARVMVAAALRDAQHSGCEYAETNWRVANERADVFWRRYGFLPTYVQLRRTVDA